MNYSRGNFGGFNFKIRGIGVDVVAFSGTTGVSINENELPLAGNNFANTDFYDVQRVEVLRGPQGTLYGRNATGGAVDVITNQPTDDFGGYASASYGNYNAIKVQGAVNIPLGDDWALRVAGFRYTQDGFGQNIYLNERVDGRDLGSIRATLSFKPNDSFDAYLMYEHYAEDDNRNRIGKQLCIKDPGPTSVGGVPIAPAGGPIFTNYAAFLNQGCLPGSLYQTGRLRHAQQQRHPRGHPGQSHRPQQRHRRLRQQPAAEPQPARHPIVHSAAVHVAAGL